MHVFQYKSKNFHQYGTNPKHIEYELKYTWSTLILLSLFKYLATFWAILNINGMTSIFCIRNEHKYKIEINIMVCF